MKVLFVNAADTSRHVSSANTAIYPNLGLLTLMSALSGSLRQSDISLGYLDGTVYDNAFIQAYIEGNHQSVSVICFSALTANYGGSSVVCSERVFKLHAAQGDKRICFALVSHRLVLQMLLPLVLRSEVSPILNKEFLVPRCEYKNFPSPDCSYKNHLVP